MAGERLEDGLGSRHTPEVHQCKESGESTVNEGAVDDDIYVVEVIPEECNPEGYREDGKSEG